jgi:hypothetical protein
MSMTKLRSVLRLPFVAHADVAVMINSNVTTFMLS